MFGRRGLRKEGGRTGHWTGVGREDGRRLHEHTTVNSSCVSVSRSWGEDVLGRARNQYLCILLPVEGGGEVHVDMPPNYHIQGKFKAHKTEHFVIS